MQKILTSLLLKFVTVDSLCALIAKAIAKMLSYASKNGGKSWDNAKAAMSKIAVWVNLFNEVYADDKLTAEEEAKIAEAIKNETPVDKISEILK